ncbi:sugar O-acetyltransferase [Intestinicryptomonas porci]|uniref:sugar O-acetyltransferase n=1 Tax=Intestinicryptomonas porci TaxID=2926320 RepID=UPI0035160029
MKRKTKELTERMLKKSVIKNTDPDFNEICEEVENTRRLVCELNNSPHTDDEARKLLEEIWGQKLDSSVRVFPPFYTAFGKLTKISKNVFINFGCTFLDQGSITIEDDVFIAPGVKITTEAHPENPEGRHNLLIKPVVIKQNAWIGANAVILPGVIIGKNAIVGAGAVVTKDVEDNAVVAGVPAKFIRKIKEKS